jgi:hypothetical protein
MRLLIIVAAAGFALAAIGHPHAQTPPPKPMPLLADANHDGKVSLAEYQSHRRNLLMSLDANKDGHIDHAEWNKGVAQVAELLKADGIDGGGRFGQAEWWTALDANKDGVITPGEIDGMTARRFKVFDTNLNDFIDGREPQLAKLGVEGGAIGPNGR